MCQANDFVASPTFQKTLRVSDSNNIVITFYTYIYITEKDLLYIGTHNVMSKLSVFIILHSFVP